MNTGFDDLVSKLKEQGYYVSDSPQEIIRERELYVDIVDIAKKEDFTGGYTFDVYVEIVLDRVDRSEALAEVENIVKTVDEAGCIVDRIETDIFGEQIRFVVVTICREVIYVG